MPDPFEINGGAITLKQNANDLPPFADTTIIRGFTLEFIQSEMDLKVNDVTQINGFTLEFLDYPAYCIPISIRRFLAS